MRDYGLEKFIYRTLREYDNTVRYTKGSGSVLASEDIIARNYIIQCKETNDSKYRIYYKDVERVYINAYKMMKEPYLIIRINGLHVKYSSNIITFYIEPTNIRYKYKTKLIDINYIKDFEAFILTDKNSYICTPFKGIFINEIGTINEA